VNTNPEANSLKTFLVNLLTFVRTFYNRTGNIRHHAAKQTSKDV